MSFPSLIRLLPGILAPLLACTAALAQIHEDDKPLPGLEEGLLFQRNDASMAPSISTNVQPLAPSTTADIGTGDFTVCFWVAAPGSDRKGGEITKLSPNAGWSVEVGERVTVKMRSSSQKDPVTMTAPLEPAAGRLRHIAAVIKREARQPLSGIWVDGVEQVSIAVPPVNLSAPTSALLFHEQSKQFVLSDIRIYNRALTRPEVLELTLRGKEDAGFDKPKPKHPAPPPNGPRFIPQQDETIALIGGTEAVALAESGELEALLLMAFPNTRFHFRSLAWEGDTVFKQDRPMNFGSLEQQLRRVNAGAVFVMFGRQECLDAAAASKDEGGRRKDEKGKPASDSSFIPHPSSLDSFKTAFGKLLDTVEKVTPNIVVIGPPPFEEKEPPLPDLAKHSAELRAYSKIMQDAAGQRGMTFSDVLGCDSISHVWEPVITLDGAILNQFGVSQTANVASYMLGFGYSLGKLDLTVPTGATTKETRDFVKAVQTKNRLWHDYWRPSNWAFLHGDRTNQPSSRDPVNPQIRFFPAEQEKYLPLIKAAEDKIYQTVQEAQKKLP